MLDWLSESWNYAMDLFARIILTLRTKPRAKRHARVEAPSYKLTYLDKQLCAKATRDTFEYGLVHYNDNRISPTEKSEQGVLPTLHIDDKLLLWQSNAILRYASKRAWTYPSNAEDAAVVDQWCEIHADFMKTLLLSSSHSSHQEQSGLFDTGFDPEKHRVWVRETHIPKHLDMLETNLVSTRWLGPTVKISMADFCWYPTLHWLHEGGFDGVSKNIFDKYPNVYEFIRDVASQLGEDDKELDSLDVESNTSEEQTKRD